jgi:hypothetical protein
MTARAVWCPASLDTTDFSLYKASSSSVSSRCQYRVRVCQELLHLADIIIS